MAATDSQREKAATVLAELLDSYGNTPAPKVARFRAALLAELEGQDLRAFGCYRGPDRIVTKALKKATIDPGAITDVIMVTFETGDKIRYFLDGGFHER